MKKSKHPERDFLGVCVQDLVTSIIRRIVIAQGDSIKIWTEIWPSCLKGMIRPQGEM